jgi:hypothetical protein
VARSIVICPATSLGAFHHISIIERGTVIGSRPFFSALFLKISANDSAITALIPFSWSAQTACSRDDPQPKLFPATMIESPEYEG